MSHDLLQTIHGDHPTIHRLQSEVRDASKLEKLINILIPHEIAEELVLFEIARKLPGGRAVVKERLSEQVKIEEQLDAIAKSDNQKYQLAKIEQLYSDINRHCASEEKTVLKLLADQCSEASLKKILTNFLRIKSFGDADTSDIYPPIRFLGPASNLSNNMRLKAKIEII